MKQQKIIYFGHVADYVTLVRKGERGEHYHVRRDRETNEEKKSRLQARSLLEEQIHVLLLQRREVRSL